LEKGLLKQHCVRNGPSTCEYKPKIQIQFPLENVPQASGFIQAHKLKESKLNYLNR